MDRRHFFQSSALVTSGALAACASTGMANQVKTPFNVAQVTLPIVGSDERYPVRRIYCIGRNYAAHAREMGSDPTREPPFFFQKPTDAIQYVPSGTVANHPYPPLTKNYHYEAELVALLGKGGRDIPVDKALDLVYGYTLGLDMTRRDLQRFMGDQKKPWEIGKSFDHSAPTGPIVPAAQAGDVVSAAIRLSVNGQERQTSTISQLIWNIGEVIEHISAAWTLQPGDLIFTGTPSGVGAVVPGDVMEGSVEGIGSITVTVV